MSTLIDLSHPLRHGQPSFPSDPELRIAAHGTVASIGYNITELRLSTHQGTHLDAPFHFFDDGRTLDQIPLACFYGSAVVVDLAPGSMLPPKTRITLDRLQAHAERFQPGARVLYRTGWDRMFGRPEFFQDFPSLTTEAARWLADRHLTLLGMDTPSPSADWKEVHEILLKRGVELVIVECLTNLDRLPERFTLAAFPLNIEGRDGSPVRAVAIADS